MSNTPLKNIQRVGPKVRVNVEYECNGCQFHTIGQDGEDNFHACTHPSIIDEYKTPQWMAGGNPGLTIHHPAPTPKYMCPYLQDKEPRDAQVK